MSAPISPEIRAILARCMSQIELEWGAPDLELREVLGVPLDAPIGTEPPVVPVGGGQTLLSCPFCGAPARLYQPRAGCWAVTCTDGDEQFTERWDRAKVYCLAAVGDRPAPYGSAEDAATAWNRRHPADALRSGEVTVNEARAARGLPPQVAPPGLLPVEAAPILGAPADAAPTDSEVADLLAQLKRTLRASC